MLMFYDLHAHSTASDGTLLASDLIKAAKNADIDVFALTDHDTVAGIELAQAMAKTVQLYFVPGIELSVTWKGKTLHIVGLYIDIQDQLLRQGIEKQLAFRQWRGEEMGRRLAKKGISDIYDKALEYAGTGVLTRTHFAKALVDKGYGNSLPKVFKHFLTLNKPGYVSGQWASLQDVLAWINAAGGLSVLAHPARYHLSKTQLRQLMKEFKGAGGDAIEVISGSQIRKEVPTLAALAKKYDLYASQGSDFHDPQYPWTRLGYLPTLPEQCKPIWQHERFIHCFQ